jgi:hypothetical protein
MLRRLVPVSKPKRDAQQSGLVQQAATPLWLSM